MAQANFDSLAIPIQSAESSYDQYPQTSADAVIFERKTYVPVNFIPAEVRSMIEAWELSEIKRQQSIEAFTSTSENAVASILSLEECESLRICNLGGPPKRFYRTFWRSVSRKLLEFDKQDALSIKKHGEELRM